MRQHWLLVHLTQKSEIGRFGRLQVYPRLVQRELSQFQANVGWLNFVGGRTETELHPVGTELEALGDPGSDDDQRLDLDLVGSEVLA